MIGAASGDTRSDLEINHDAFQAGTYLPNVETHLMEHGLNLLEGQGLRFLGTEWHEI